MLLLCAPVVSCRELPVNVEPACGASIELYADQEIGVGFDRRTSQEVLVGRRVMIAADRYRRSFDRSFTPENAVDVTWCSQDTQVLLPTGSDSGFGVAPGESVLFARDARGRADSLTVRVVTTGYSVTFIGEGTIGVALNDSGDVVGTDPAGGFLWSTGNLVSLGACIPAAVNDRLQVACRGTYSQTSPGIWANGFFTAVTLPGATSVDVTAVNDSGDVGGNIYITGGGPEAFIIIKDDTLRFGGHTTGGMNNLGQLVGLKTNVYALPTVFSRAGASSFGNRYNAIYTISDSGVAVGEAAPYSSQNRRPVQWPAWNLFGTLPVTHVAGSGWAFPEPVNPLFAAARGVNNSGAIVGTGLNTGFLWRDGRTINLNAVLHSPEWEIIAAVAIDNSGRILAQGRNLKTGQSGAVLLHPSPTSADP